MKINWFSPLSPAKTGIAYTTGVLLPALSKRVEVTVWTEQETWEPELEQWARVRRFDPEHEDWREFNQADISFYNLGNNSQFHSGIWRVCQQVPGIVVLHDVRLQNFFAGYYREGQNDREGYVAEMERYHGEVGRVAAEAFWKGDCGADDLADQFPLTALAVERALGVILHTPSAFDQHNQHASRPAAYCPLPEPLETMSRRKTSNGSAPSRLIIFGHIGFNRRVESVLGALAGLPQKERFQLDIYGELWDENLVRTRIMALGLERIVQIHGFVSDEELATAIANADLGINLRYPPMGEASGSQLRLWRHAIPSLVTQMEYSHDIPADTVGFVRPEFEIEDLRAHLLSFLSEPDRFAEMGKRGRQFLEENHRPEAYVEGLLHMVARARRFGVNRLANALADRVGIELGGWTTPDHLQPTCRQVATALTSLLAQTGSY